MSLAVLIVLLVIVFGLLYANTWSIVYLLNKTKKWHIENTLITFMFDGVLLLSAGFYYASKITVHL